jgi:hypothetical protein
MTWGRVFVVFGVLAVGCDGGGGSSVVDASTDLPPFSVTVRWKLENAAGEPQPCPAGFDTAEVIVLGVRGGVQSSNPFPCTDGEGVVTIRPVPRESYGVMVRIRDGVDGPLFGETFPALASGDVTLTVITDLGRLRVHWTLSQGGVTRTCADLGIDMVQIEVTPAQGQPMTRSAFCVLGQEPTNPLPTGTARVVVTAGTTSGSLDNVAVPTGGLFADVPPIDLAF